MLMVKNTITKKSTDTVEELERQRTIAGEKIRQLKRTESENELTDAVHEVLDTFQTDKKNLKRVLDACYNYIAQHRALFRKGGFNQSGEYID